MKPLRWTRPTWSQIKRTVLYYATHYTWAFVAVMVVTLLSCSHGWGWVIPSAKYIPKIFRGR